MEWTKTYNCNSSAPPRGNHTNEYGLPAASIVFCLILRCVIDSPALITLLKWIVDFISPGILYAWALYVPPTLCSWITTVSITSLSGQHFSLKFCLISSHLQRCKWAASGGLINVQESFWVSVYKKATEEP
jgi:hypothetical protein